MGLITHQELLALSRAVATLLPGSMGRADTVVLPQCLKEGALGFNQCLEAFCRCRKKKKKNLDGPQTFIVRPHQLVPEKSTRQSKIFLVIL